MSELKGHTNIVTYEDHRVIPHEDHIGWDILIRMELLTSLLDYSEEHEITEQTVIKLGTDILTALEVCQKYHVVHRDIKPENIFVSATGDFKLGDFGIASTIEKTTFGMSKKGTYPYMAPEIYQGKESDILVDMYSLGLVMYRILNDNRLPFFPEYPKKVTYVDRENALYRRIQGETFPKPRHGGKELGNIVMKSCQYQKEDRYGSILQMKEALECLNGNTSKNLNRIYGMTDAKKRQVRQREEGTVGLFEQNFEKRKQQEERRDITEPVTQKEQVQTPKKKNRALLYALIAVLAVGFLGVMAAVFIKIKSIVPVNNTEKEQIQTEESNDKKADSKKQQKKKEKKTENTKEDTTEQKQEEDTEDSKQENVDDSSAEIEQEVPKTKAQDKTSGTSTAQEPETSQTPSQEVPQTSEPSQTPETPQAVETPQASEPQQATEAPQTSQEPEQKENNMLIDGADSEKKPEINIDGAE